MELVVIVTSFKERYHFINDQITNYDWVDGNFIINATDLLLSIIPPNGEFESLDEKNNRNEIEWTIKSLMYLTDINAYKIEDLLEEIINVINNEEMQRQAWKEYQIIDVLINV